MHNIIKGGNDSDKITGFDSGDEIYIHNIYNTNITADDFMFS